MPTSSESPSNHVSVYVRVFNGKDSRQEWYSIELLNNSTRVDDDGIEVLIPFQEKKDSCNGSCAAVDSTIYCIGGTYSLPLLNTVHSWNTTSTSTTSGGCWKKCQEMRNCRSGHQVAVLNGKIYVFGGLRLDASWKPWAEVFDTKLDKWVSLISPSPLPKEGRLFSVALPDHNKVLVGSWLDDFVYVYNVEDRSWEQWKTITSIEYAYPFPYNVKPVAVDTTLFWFEDQNLHAYDLIKHWYYSCPVKGLHKFYKFARFDDYCTPVLLRIGTTGYNFCLVCVQPLYLENDLGFLHCIVLTAPPIVRVKRGVQKVFVNAVVQSCQTYMINSPEELLDALLLEVEEN